MTTETIHTKVDEDCSVLVASTVYLLMNKSYQISRNVRAQWLLQHLNSTISVPSCPNQVETDLEELVVVSVLPQDPPESWSVDTRHHYVYLVTTTCNIVFFSEIYSTVYCLDMSPSLSSVDIQHGEVMIDEIVKVFSRSLKGVVSPFNIPGSSVMFEPQIFVTVIVHTPFFTTPAQQVLVQGWQVTPENLEEFLAAIRKQLQLLEDTIADVSALAYDQLEAVRIQQMESDRLVGGLFEESPEKQVGMSTAEIPMVSPDSGFINLLRYGMLALQLLPQSSLSNLVVVTDGVISLPDIHVLELVLTQLRAHSVAVSFLQVGSQFHPQCSEGLVPYSELLQFIACATFGTYIPHSTTQNSISEGVFNSYHEAFLTWNFKKGSNVQELCTPVPRVGEWFISNQSFYGNREPQLLTKKQTEDILEASLTSVLCCRLHEGFIIKSVSVRDGIIELNLMLPWANHIYIEYLLTSDWPAKPNGTVQYCISIKAPYEFLHDITCLVKKQFKSPYRQAVVSRFWNTLKTLSQSDLLLAHLDSFPSISNSYTIPESIRNGMPLFYLPSITSQPALSSSDISSPHFALFWRPICLLDPSVWHKWMHTHSVSIVFQHDMPLPKFLYIPSPNGRFQGLLCRQAAATLYNFLKDSTSFVLLENHSFIKFIFKSESDKIPTWFYIVRMQQKPPCAVIHIAFLLSTPGKLRHKIVEDLKQKISEVTTSQRASKKESTGRNMIEEIHSAARSNVLCCTLLNKPLEKILIRYERMPSEFGTVVFPDGTQPLTASKPLGPTASLVTTLSRYLHHRRWIWSASFQNHDLGVVRVSKILGLLTQMRLEEGFRFAHSTAGIVNMVLEVQMKCCDQENDHMCENCRPCIIQYVLFPLNVSSPPEKDWSSEEEEEAKDLQVESTIELIAECWIEPQHGVVANGPPQRAYMDRLPYHQLADSMWRMDAECISTILTFEQLRMMSQNPLVPVPPRMDPLESQPRNPLENWPHATALSDKRIQKIPFAYNTVSILPDSQQIELEFPMFIQDVSEDWRVRNFSDVPNILLMDSLVKQIKTLHDKELHLNPIESKQFLESVFKRKRNFQQHPVPFPDRQRSGSSSKSSSKLLSEKDVKEADKENECPRTNNVITSTPEKLSSSNLSPLPSTADKSKQSSPVADNRVRKSCGPLYRMYTKTPLQMPCRRDISVERDTPKWRFFVKKMSESYIILTFIPASYQDCKALMLGAEPKACSYLPDLESMVNIIEEYSLSSERMEAEEDRKHVGESKLNPEAKPFHPYMLNRDMLALLNCPSPLSSRGWIVESNDSASNVFDSVPSITDLQNHSTWEVNQENLDPVSPFRLRARSWEPMKPQSVLKAKKHISPRMRTRSVGSKGKPWNEGKLKQKLLNCGSNSLVSLNNTSSKEILGSINVPIYVYGCCIDNLVDSLVLKSAYTKDFKDLYWRKPMKSNSEGGFEQDEMMEDLETLCLPDTSDDTTLIQEYDLQQHAKTLTQMFSKSFGVSLFKSLHVGHRISSFNVQSAMEECEEAVVQINMTDYLQIVCRHLKEVKDKHMMQQEIDEVDQEIMFPFSIFEDPVPCQKYKQLHKLIKNKFHHIITASFKPVPTNPDYFFCSPLWVKEPKVDANKSANTTTLEDKKTVEPNQDVDANKAQPQTGEIRSEQGSAIGPAGPPSEGVGSVTTPEEAHTSLLSNMDSDSVSIGPGKDISEDISPLFLQLICTVNCKGQFANCVVRILPTCLGEIINNLDFIQSSLDLNAMSVSLDILCLTLPQPEKPSPTLYPDAAYQYPKINISNTEQVKVRSTPYTGLTVTSMPDYQHKAVVTCADEIQWLLKDEIAAFLLDTNPVTETTLQFIADHVTSSVGRSSCILQNIPLHFVFGPEKSLQIFLKDISDMRVPGYCLKKEEDFYYLVKDSSPSDSYKEGTLSLALSRDLWVNTSFTGEDAKPSTDSPNNHPEPRLEIDHKSCGWSSIAAWHAEVSHLMESGTLLEGFDGKEEVMDQHSDWLNDLELKRLELPNFWLIMKINQESVISYFHCRFLELETAEVKLYSLVQKKVVNSIKALCKTVNQKMLLNNLHDTRMCNQLIEPESTEEKWKGTFAANQPQIGSPEKESAVAEILPTVEATLKYVPGWFSCPVVWETNFTLHHRLKTGSTKPGLSRGIQALRTVLNRFSVNNRNNMFVYQDNSANVFYLRLYENTKAITKSLEGEESSPLSVSRSSSVTSLNLAGIKKTDEVSSSITSAVSRDVRPRLKSFGEISDSIRIEEFITLKVHGISEAGTEVKNDLVQVLQNRLDDAVLEVLSVMLARNPMCKLTPEDIHFIQKPNHLPDSTIQFSLPKEALNHLQAVFYYLQQNLLQFLHIPKYTDTKPQSHFQDFSHPEEIVKQVTESNIYLFNQSATSGNKGLACVAVAMVDQAGNILEQLSYQKPSMTSFQDERFVAGQFNTLTATNVCQPEDDEPVRVEFRLWKQGRVNIESLTLKLKAAIRHALWDLTLEMKLLTAPLSSFDPPSMDEDDEYTGSLNIVYQSIIAPWMQFGHKLGVPAVSTHVVTLSLRHPVNITLKELSNLVTGDGTACYTYYQKNTDYLPYNWSTLPPTTNCLLIARNMDQWRASLMADCNHQFDRLEPKAQKLLQKFSPFLVTVAGEIVQFVPRQRFLIAIVNNEKAILHTYNWAKDLVETLLKQVSLLGQWLSARSYMQICIAYQKMGLYHKQPLCKNNEIQMKNPYLNSTSDVENLITFTGSAGNARSGRSSGWSASQLQDALRGAKPVSRRTKSSDPVSTSIKQLLDTKAQDKRVHQKKLYTMWQSRGTSANIPIPDEVMELFLHYSRIVHYCVTPLLFLPRWRIQSASTRDFSLKAHKNLSQTQDASPQEEKWHQKLCANFMDEYKIYIQSLGFIPIQCIVSPKRGMRNTKIFVKDTKNVCYLQKSLLGGILLFELCMCEPFFNAKLYALESTRLEGKSTSGVMPQFTLSFLDECDKMKVLMHLHSFTYDYHLRTLARFIANQDSLLQPGYHITNFLDDFLKYYSKAPNYAYCLVHSGSLVIPKISSSALEMFNYLLNHQKNYPMKVLQMATASQDLDDKPLTSSSEYVLTKRNNGSQIMYRDIQDNKQIYEYDIVLIVVPEESPDKTVLRLCYYILLSSKREPYAKLESEKKLGKFRTVSTAGPLNLYTMSRETTPPIPEETPEELAEGYQSTQKTNYERRSSSHVEIKPESVNYLGYYSSHEQFMQQLILEQANVSKKLIEETICTLSSHCRTHLLWRKLNTASSSAKLTYAEFCELLSLATSEALGDKDPRISPILAQPLNWYMGLSKLIMVKYTDQYRSFVSPDNLLQYMVILHPKWMDGFIMITSDFSASRAELSIVTNTRAEDEKMLNVYLPILIEDVINSCCFHLWTGLL